MVCPQCQEIEKDGARFCSNCGFSFTSFNTPTEPAEALPETLPNLDPLAGQTLDGKYELLARLGEGGMGTVYRARRVHIGDEVAVKVLLGKYVADSGLVERFRREARAAAMLRHPNVVAIHDYGEARSEDAPAYIVMELVEGESLRRLLQRESRLPPERAIQLMLDICAGVGAAHRRDGLHRDLKPDNIIVLPPDEDREHETVKVVDFGLAKLRDTAGAPTLTQTGMIMGTPYYMSPEQCRGEHLDARADVYSLGALLYEMLAGAPPFTARNVAGVYAKHLTDAPPPLPEALSIPPALEALIMRALAKDQDARPANATELARELRAEEESIRRREAEARREQKEEQRLKAEARRREAEENERQRREAAERHQRETEAAARGRVTKREAVTARAESAAVELATESVETLARQAPGRAASPAFNKAIMITIAAVLAIVTVGVAVALWFGGSGESANTAQVNANTSAVNQTQSGQLTGGAAARPARATNRYGIELVYVPAGSFMMGAENGEADEKPVHRVTISDGFYMGMYEVTQAQWTAVMGSNPSDFKGENRPVETVSWDDAQTFIRKLNEANDGYTYRLPSEAEWEYAARAGTTGDYAGNLDAMAWYGDNSGNNRLNSQAIFDTDGANYYKRITENGNQTHPVGQKQPNAFGLYDMHGNVWEWCQDYYQESYAGAPSDGSAWLSGKESKYRVLRGGSWGNVAGGLRSAVRGGVGPGERLGSSGFRVVASART